MSLLRYIAAIFPSMNATGGPTRFDSYDEFFAFYMRQHSQRSNRVLHACGTSIGLLTVIVAFALGHPWWAFLWIPIAYGFAWTGHFVIERNKPASFGHPWWSFVSDFRMLALMVTGRLGPWIEDAKDSTQHSAFSGK
jgi:hypothetical protein